MDREGLPSEDQEEIPDLGEQVRGLHQDEARKEDTLLQRAVMPADATVREVPPQGGGHERHLQPAHQDHLQRGQAPIQ